MHSSSSNQSTKAPIEPSDASSPKASTKLLDARTPLVGTQSILYEPNILTGEFINTTVSKTTDLIPDDSQYVDPALAEYCQTHVFLNGTSRYPILNHHPTRQRYNSKLFFLNSGYYVSRLALCDEHASSHSKPLSKFTENLQTFLSVLKFDKMVLLLPPFNRITMRDFEPSTFLDKNPSIRHDFCLEKNKILNVSILFDREVDADYWVLIEKEINWCKNFLICLI